VTRRQRASWLLWEGARSRGVHEARTGERQRQRGFGDPLRANPPQRVKGAAWARAWCGRSYRRAFKPLSRALVRRS
jgi:hypothetical protein